ncbi:MAG: hypothetical protein RLZZ471_754, partial [Actinomycetota bacterium]
MVIHWELEVLVLVILETGDAQLPQVGDVADHEGAQLRLVEGPERKLQRGEVQVLDPVAIENHILALVEQVQFGVGR